jgi:hypothetical protein
MPPLPGVAAVMDRVRELIAVAGFMADEIETSNFPLQGRIDVSPIAGDIADRDERIGQVGEQIASPRKTALTGPTDGPP